MHVYALDRSCQRFSSSQECSLTVIAVRNRCEMPVPILARPYTGHGLCVRTGQTVRGAAAVPPRLAKHAAITGASRLPLSPWPRRAQLASHQAVRAPPWRVGRLSVVTPAAVAVPAGGRPKESRASRGFKAKLSNLLTPFSDHQANAKLLALCTGKCSCCTGTPNLFNQAKCCTQRLAVSSQLHGV